VLINAAVLGGGGLSGVVSVGSGGTVSGTGIMAGGKVTVESGGSVSGGSVSGTSSSHGTLIISGGDASGISVQAGGVMSLTDSGTDSGGSVAGVSGSPGEIQVTSGGSTSGTDVSGGGLLQIGAGGQAAGGYASGSSANLAQVQVLSGGSISAFTVYGGGELTVSGSGSAAGITVSSGGEFLVDSGGSASGISFDGGTVEFAAGSVTGSGSLVFSGTSGTLVIDGTVLPANVISGFNTTDLIHLTGIAYDSAGGAVLGSGNVLTITEGDPDPTYTLDFDPSQDFSGDDFKVIADPSGTGIDVLEEVACFARGTLIATPQGEVPVEELRVGEWVLTLEGERLPIQWIGRRAYRGVSALANPDVMPICVRVGALSEHRPRRDLWVSPCHALLVDGVLIPAGLLVNGVSIVRPEGLREIHYFHIELERHAIILAENAPAETFVDDGSRGMFDNVADYYAAHPRCAPAWPLYCAPRLEDGFELELIRQHLQRRARALEYRDEPRRSPDKEAWDVEAWGVPVGEFDTGRNFGREAAR
jgi:hypothetical protein